MYFPSACEVAVNVTYDTREFVISTEDGNIVARNYIFYESPTQTIAMLRLGRCQVQAAPLARVPSTLPFSM